MRQSRIRPSLAPLMVLLLTAVLLGACDEEGCLCPPPERVVISGMALDMPFATPLAGATIQLVANDYVLDDPNYVRSCECEGDLCDYRTLSDDEGYWAMEVPVKYTEAWAPYNMLIKVSKGGGPPQYNLFQAGGTNQGDLQLLSETFFNLFAQDAIAGGADPDELAVVFGVAIGFVETGYPGVIAMQEGVKVTVTGGSPVEEFPVTYLGEAGLPDPDLTETSSMGVFYTAVPDANTDAVPSIKVSGEKPGQVFVESFFATCPGSCTSAAVIDPYYQP